MEFKGVASVKPFILEQNLKVMIETEGLDYEWASFTKRPARFDKHDDTYVVLLEDGRVVRVASNHLEYEETH
jgi:hypothetical protein